MLQTDGPRREWQIIHDEEASLLTMCPELTCQYIVIACAVSDGCHLVTMLPEID